MKYFTKISDSIDVKPLLAQIAAHPELWDAQQWRKKIPGGPHARMSDIWVRYNAPENIGPHFNDEHVSVWYPAYGVLTALKPIIWTLMAQVEGKRLGGILVTRIPSGAGIDRHVDRGWHVETFDKFYVSLQSAPGAKFICYEGDGEVLEPKPGECWRFDNRLPHAVANDSTEDRMTLIVCIETEKYSAMDTVRRLGRARELYAPAT